MNSAGAAALLPPLGTLLVVLLTRRIIPALIAGVLLGGVIAYGPFLGIPKGIYHYFLERLITPWNLRIAGFALSVLSMVKLAEASGGMAALFAPVMRRMGSRRSILLGTGGMGLCVFFDDYANTFLVGPSVRPLTDRAGISREKLAYIVDSTAAPVAGLALASTWVGYEVGLLEDVLGSMGLDSGGYQLLLVALPLRFYCLFALATVFVSSWMGRDFKAMHERERAATEQLPSARTEQPIQHPRWAWLNAALPILVLLLGTALGFLVDGGAHRTIAEDLSALWRASTLRDALSSAEHGDLVLVLAGAASLLTACGSSLMTRQLVVRQLVGTLQGALRLALRPIAILYLAWALAAACKDVGTGAYLIQQLGGGLPGPLLPLLTFSMAAVVALATGTSWGTMAILIPTALPLAHEIGGYPLLCLSAAAVLDGAIFGDHCSPLSDTTVLSSTACGCDLVSHVWTQLPYALTAMVIAALAYAACGFLGWSAWLLYPLGVLMIVLVLRVSGRRL